MPFKRSAAVYRAALPAAAAALLSGLLLTAPAASAAEEPVPVAPHRGLVIRADAAPELVLDVTGSTTDDLATVGLQRYTGANDQLWLVVPVGRDSFQIRNVHSHKCLDVRANSTEPNADIIQYTCHGGANQIWQLRPSDRGGNQLVSARSGLCLDVYREDDNEPVAGSRLVQHTCSDPANNDQRWSFGTA